MLKVPMDAVLQRRDSRLHSELHHTLWLPLEPPEGGTRAGVVCGCGMEGGDVTHAVELHLHWEDREHMLQRFWEGTITRLASSVHKGHVEDYGDAEHDTESQTSPEFDQVDSIAFDDLEAHLEASHPKPAAQGARIELLTLCHVFLCLLGNLTTLRGA